MSSKIVLAEASAAASPVVWRQVQPGALAGSPGGEAAGQLAQVERQNEERVREARAAGLREGEAAARNYGAAELKRTLDRAPRCAAGNGDRSGCAARPGDGRPRKTAGAGYLARQGSSVARRPAGSLSETGAQIGRASCRARG